MSRLVLALAALYGLGMSWFTLQKDQRLAAGILDLGIHEQTVWLASQGLNPWLTSRGLSAFADHFSPVAWLLAVPYQLWPGPEILLSVQALLTASGAWPVFRLAARRASEPAAAALAALYLLNPVVQWQNAFDFHFTVLTTPLLLWALHFLEEERPWAYALSLGLTLACGEALGFTVLTLAWTIRRSSWAWPTAAAGLGGLVLAAEAMRLASGGAASQYGSLYPTDLFSAQRVLAAILTEDTQNLFLLLLLPLAGLPLLAPEKLVPALPVLLGNLLSWRQSQHDFHCHYEAAVLPFLFWAAAEGLPRLRDPRWLAAPAFLCWLLGPLAPWRGLPAADYEAWTAVLDSLPAETSISAENRGGSRVSARQQVYLFPNPFQAAAWGNSPQALAETASNEVHPLEPGALRRAAEDAQVDQVVFLTGLPNPCPLAEADRHHFLRVLLSTPLYGVRHAGPGVVILERGAPRWTGPAPVLEDGD